MDIVDVPPRRMVLISPCSFFRQLFCTSQARRQSRSIEYCSPYLSRRYGAFIAVFVLSSFPSSTMDAFCRADRDHIVFAIASTASSGGSCPLHPHHIDPNNNTQTHLIIQSSHTFLTSRHSLFYDIRHTSLSRHAIRSAPEWRRCYGYAIDRWLKIFTMNNSCEQVEATF